LTCQVFVAAVLFVVFVVEARDSLDNYFEAVAADILEVVVDIPVWVAVGSLVGYSPVERGILVVAVVVVVEGSHHN